MYFVIVMVMGNFILLNMFLAIMLQNAQSDDDENEQSKEAAQENALEDGDSTAVALSRSATTTQPKVAPPEERARRRGLTLANASTPVQPEETKPQKRLSKKNSSLGTFALIFGKLMGTRNSSPVKSRKLDNRSRLKRGAQQMKSLLISRKSRKNIVPHSNKHKAQFCLKYALVQPGYSYLYAVIAIILV